MVDLDVLIIGGGAQGLWVLNDLTKRNYRTVLLERGELGGGQTCHSHGLIHRGHYYDDVDMMIVLNAAAQFWEAFVDERGISRLNHSRALAGFGPGMQAERHTYFWKTAGLRFDPCQSMPGVLDGGRVSQLFETEEFSLDPSEVIAGLSGDLDHAIYKLEKSNDAMEFVVNGNLIERVQAKLEGEHVEFAPKYLVICAGVGNYGLMAKLGRDVNPGGEIPVQAQRKNHMMVLRGDHLPRMTAVFPIRGGLQGVFLCPREDPATGQPVWLASDHNSLPFPMNPQGEASVDSRPSKDWIRRMLISLRATAPALFADADVDGLEVAVYTGPTSERNFGVGQHMTDLFIDPFGFENALTVWPTKLTMTPFASNVVMRFVRTKVAEPGGAWPRVERVVTAPSPEISPEMWCREAFEAPHESKTPWMPYADFMDTWQLN